jgi:hypothetical protein
MSENWALDILLIPFYGRRIDVTAMQVFRWDELHHFRDDPPASASPVQDNVGFEPWFVFRNACHDQTGSIRSNLPKICAAADAFLQISRRLVRFIFASTIVRHPRTESLTGICVSRNLNSRIRNRFDP